MILGGPRLIHGCLKDVPNGDVGVPTANLPTRSPTGSSTPTTGGAPARTWPTDPVEHQFAFQQLRRLTPSDNKTTVNHTRTRP